jgi:hypothetical protein
VIENIDDFRALDLSFRIIEQGLAGLVDGEHFFDLLADDASSRDGTFRTGLSGSLSDWICRQGMGTGVPKK